MLVVGAEFLNGEWQTGGVANLDFVLLSFFARSQKERERIIDNKRQVQSLVNKSKTIVRLKPRNPEEKSSSPVMVQALCDFKQEQVGNSLCHTDTH